MKSFTRTTLIEQFDRSIAHSTVCCTHWRFEIARDTPLTNSVRRRSLLQTLLTVSKLCTSIARRRKSCFCRRCRSCGHRCRSCYRHRRSRCCNTSWCWKWCREWRWKRCWRFACRCWRIRSRRWRRRWCWRRWTYCLITNAYLFTLNFAICKYWI